MLTAEKSLCLRDKVSYLVGFVTMPPHSSSNYLAMPTKIMKTPPGTPPSEESELRSPLAGPAGDKKATWKSYRKTTSKITPKQPSPNRAPFEKAKNSKSGNTTPTKELKSCLKKPSDGSQKSGVSSPLQSYRSELTQHSHRSEFNESMFDNSLSASLFQDPDDEEAKDLDMTQQETWLTDPASASEPLDDVPVKRDSKGSRKKEIPTSFIDALDAVGDSPHLGPYLIKLAKSQASGENPVKALEYCIRAVKFYERNSERESSLDLVISLHILATLHCQLGQYEDAVGLLERSLKIPDLGQGEEHALATFSGHMQLGDTLNLGGKQKLSIDSYQRALEVQKLVLGEFDNRVAETCNYLAEAHLQVRPFLKLISSYVKNFLVALSRDNDVSEVQELPLRLHLSGQEIQTLAHTGSCLELVYPSSLKIFVSVELLSFLLFNSVRPRNVYSYEDTIGELKSSSWRFRCSFVCNHCARPFSQSNLAHAQYFLHQRFCPLLLNTLRQNP